MKITDFREERWPQANVLARFSVALSPDITLIGLKLKRRNDGSYTVAPPNLRGVACAHLAPALTRQITEAAAAALNGGRVPHACRS